MLLSVVKRGLAFLSLKLAAEVVRISKAALFRDLLDGDLREQEPAARLRYAQAFGVTQGRQAQKGLEQGMKPGA